MKLNDNIEILNKEFLGAKYKAFCRCKLDGYEWSTTWNSLFSGSGCSRCSGHEKHSIEYIKSKFEEYNLIPLFETYKNAKQKLLAKTKDGYFFLIKFDSLITQRGSAKLYHKTNPYTMDNIKLWMSRNCDDIKLLSTEYIDSDSNLKCLCLHDNTEFETCWSRIYQGQGCPKCAGNARLKLSDIIDRLNTTNKNIKILSEQYYNNSTKLECLCLIHNHIFYTNWANLSNSKGCPKCAKNEKLTLDKIVSEFKNKNLEPLFDSCKNVYEKLLARTPEGYLMEVCYNDLKNSKGHSWIASPKNKYTIENIKRWLVLNNPQYTLVSNVYERNDKKLIFKCEKHGEFLMAWGNMLSGKRCRDCYIESVSGKNSYLWTGKTAISDYIRRKISDWKTKSFKLYNYRCDISNINDGTLVIHHLTPFYKILNEAILNLNIENYDTIEEYEEAELLKLKIECIRLHEYYGLGVCLTKAEHDLFHKTYGKKNNTPEQYYEFKENRTKNNFKEVVI